MAHMQEHETVGTRRRRVAGLPRAGLLLAATLAIGGVFMAGNAEAQGSGQSASESELDLREANVTDVRFEERGEEQYRFDVTLIHDDAGEDGYANWWQVETLDGSQLGRRTLLHAHGTREFTRSETIEIPDGVSRVVVRAHDQTHGYGGQAAIVSLDDGSVAFVMQGEERRNLSEE